MENFQQNAANVKLSVITDRGARCLALCLLLMAWCSGLAQSSAPLLTEQELWAGLVRALEQDLNVAREAAEAERLQSVRTDIDATLKAAEELLASPLDHAALARSLAALDALEKNPDADYSRQNRATYLQRLLYDYPFQAQSLLDLFDKEHINAQMPSVKIFLSLDEPSPIFVTDMADEVHESMRRGGLDSLVIPGEYVYLNKLLDSIRRSFAAIAADPTMGKLAKLRSLLELENVISTSHKCNPLLSEPE